MNFIVIEGLDGAGKSTQIRMLEKYFLERDLKCKFIHFPRHEAPVYGELVSRFLRGELGEIDTVNPYLVALIYAGDRNDAAPLLRQWMHEGYVVIADRYLYSNIAFQCAKLENATERRKLAAWIKSFEYQYNKIPLPDLNLYLNVPFDFAAGNLKNNRNGTDREYLKGAKDIHEANESFQKKVHEMYQWQVKENDDFNVVECTDESGHIRNIDDIFNRILTWINKL